MAVIPSFTHRAVEHNFVWNVHLTRALELVIEL